MAVEGDPLRQVEATCFRHVGNLEIATPLFCQAFLGDRVRACGDGRFRFDVCVPIRDGRNVITFGGQVGDAPARGQHIPDHVIGGRKTD